MASNPIDQGILEAVGESLCYEHYRLARRRGFVNLAFGLVLFGAFVAGLGNFTTRYPGVPWNAIGWPIILVGGAGVLVARLSWNRWPGLFDGQGRSLPDSMRDWKLRPGEWPTVALALSGFVFVAFSATVFQDAPQHDLLAAGIASGLALAAIPQFVGSRSGDRALFWIGWACVPFVLALGFSPVNQYNGALGDFWENLPTASFLIGLGLARLVKPRRWFYR